MSHLLALSVGPVQEFIAAARRTRDLWFGSYLLSEISKAVAQSVSEQGGTLIFPHPETDLTPSKEEVNVANIVLAELPGGDPAAVADRAKQAARGRWRQFADETYQEACRVIRKEIWDEQVDDVIEFYAAWTRQTGHYADDRQKLMRLLAGRKNCRDFVAAKGHTGVPKSSLDGQRESVLIDPKRQKWPARFRARWRIREGEQLDAVGLVKRVAEGNRPYPSVSRIAADPWLRGNADRLADLKRHCEDLAHRGLLRRLDTGLWPHFQTFPYEGTAVYPFRHHELIDETESTLQELQPLRRALARLPEAQPYLAVLVADGDSMGKAISNLPDAAANRHFSRMLSGFADEARKIVADHRGVLVYAGGDDVLAFLPLDQCLPCARKLHDDFGSRLREFGQPTLSVGIAIGHFIENLEDLLDYARAAEKHAKRVKNKDALAVHLHKRSGAPIEVAARWVDRPDESLTLYADLIRTEALPSKLPYDLHKLVEIYRAPGWDNDNTRRDALQKDALRVIADKQPRAGRQHMPTVRRVIGGIASASELQRFCEELLVARQLAVARQQAGLPATQPLL
ncbi:MAG: type III-B CRISPR-associated protein Cas10/Cmr2 [Gemmataceae bacterium]|nr:type III-B CRISPR-associated protein Cas10/Cmr2 [Gemmataceae bacterium]MDW8266398.1 type III-B CRISPR-associated protein Cas10/Cmr2 [Gemmataceae bacterium]